MPESWLDCGKSLSCKGLRSIGRPGIQAIITFRASYRYFSRAIVTFKDTHAKVRHFKVNLNMMVVSNDSGRDDSGRPAFTSIVTFYRALFLSRVLTDY